MESVGFREADLADAASIGTLHVASWRETYSGILPNELLGGLSVEARSAMWRAVLSDSQNGDGMNVFIAESRSRIVGFGASGAQRDPVLRAQGFHGEIGAIYVLEAYQRVGIGIALMRLMAKRLLDQGRKAGSLWVLRDNAPARLFYERLGGSLIGEKLEEMSGTTLIEVAYGWSDLASLVA